MLDNKVAFYIFIRYIFLALIAFNGLYLFYLIFTPLTVYPVFFILKLLASNVSLSETTVIINLVNIELVQACIAGAAYYFLLVLNFTTPLSIEKRIRSLSFLIFSFLVLNIIRIVVFSLLAVNNFSLFNITHKLFWYLGSTILVVAIWFASAYLFKIKSVPVYSDFREIYESINLRKKRPSKVRKR